MLCTCHLVNQLRITIIAIDRCQKAYHVTAKKLDCPPGHVSDGGHYFLHGIYLVNNKRLIDCVPSCYSNVDTKTERSCLI